MTRLRRLWTTGLMTSALILGSALLGHAQTPTQPQNQPAGEPQLLAYLDAHKDDLQEALPHGTNKQGLSNTESDLLVPRWWSLQQAVNSLRVSFQTGSTPRLSTGMEAHGQVFRVQRLPYPSGVFGLPPLPGHAPSLTLQAQQHGYTLFRWSPGRGFHH